MLVVKVELHSARTGEVSEIGQMHICNTGTGSKTRGDYRVTVFRKGTRRVSRVGALKGFPRLSYSVWRLVTRALVTVFPEEAP